MNRPIRLLFDSEAAPMVERVKQLPEADKFELLTYLGEKPGRLDELIATADAAYIYKDELSARGIENAPALKFIQKHGLNCKNIDVEAATRRKIAVATLPLVRNAAVAEHAFALMLACARKILTAHQAVSSGVYKEMGLTPVRTAQRQIRANWAKISGISELMGSSVGIVGLGDIGMELARRCRAFRMNVFYHQRTRLAPNMERSYEVTYLGLNDLLREVDYLILIIPHTAETDRMIGAAQFDLMKASSILINVARGGVVDEPALVDALSRGKISMAGLDVYAEEPLPNSSLLAKMPNVVLTPHIAAGSYGSHQADLRSGLENISRFFRGETPEGIINGPTK